MTHSFIIAARRTPVVPHGGALSTMDIHELGAPVVRACLEDAGLSPDQVDDLICANAIGGGGNPARLVALAAGLPDRVAGLSIDRQCVGGLDAILLADAMIRAGQADVIIAGGAESYSRRPIRMRTSENAPPVAYDSPPFTPWPDRDPDMAVAADAIGIARDIQDAWAVKSHQKARAATHPEIVPMAGIDRDPYARRLTAATCARAKSIAGDVTFANTSVAADAAAFVVVVSAKIAANMPDRAIKIITGATRGDAPERPALAPIGAIKAALEHAALAPSDIAVVEMMEAYAAQAVACVDGAGLSADRCNLGGGALARGHPIGASGAILATRLYQEMQARDGFGLAAIAAAGGLGSALILGR